MKRPAIIRAPKWLALLSVAFALVVLASTVFVLTHVNAVGTDPIAADAVTSAWQRARESGAYHFTSDVVQVTSPAATLTNVGHTSRQERLYLEGETNQPRKVTNLKLWSDSATAGGSALVPASGIEVQIADGKTRIRRGGSGPWEESDDGSVGFSYEGDFLAYLAAMRDVVAQPTETRNGITFTRYIFTIDGPAFANYARDQMQHAMQARGEMPTEVQLRASPYYAGMSGDGELWVGTDGLPLRQILRLIFPDQRDEQVSAQVTTNFSNFAVPVQGIAVISNPTLFWQTFSTVAQGMAILALATTLGIGMVFFSRKRQLQSALAILLITSMILGPQLVIGRTVRFFDVQRARAASEPPAEVQFDAHANQLSASALAVAQATSAAAVDTTCVPGAADQDQDGLTDSEEITTSVTISDTDQDGLGDCTELKVWFTDPTNPDTDGDTLTDFQEVSLGTEARTKDSDGDKLTDDQELNGFLDSYGVRWHSDPLRADTNRDGITDFMEFSNAPNGGGLLDDTDGDKTPDLFDTDNDGDGVLDKLDLSPFARAGSKEVPFTTLNPFQLTLNNLEVGMPTLVDLQVRPVNTDRLWYAYNVLDWPTDDAGQIQDVDNLTFAQAAKTDLDPSTAAAPENHGDMRLSPMLEIRIKAPNGATNAPLSAYGLPPLSTLIAYNISVITMTVNNDPEGAVTGKIIYAPLSLVTDAESGQQVAFRTTVPYFADSASWPSAQEMRMVWSVQMLLDIPCDPTDPELVTLKCIPDGGVNPYLFDLTASLQSDLDQNTISPALKAAFIGSNVLTSKAELSTVTAGSHWQIVDGVKVFIIRRQANVIKVFSNAGGTIYNLPQVVQSYPDEWLLTGVSVSEEHGVKLGILYEDPAVDTDLNSDDALITLAHGMDDTFVSVSDRNNDQEQDITVAELARRFNRATNDAAGVTLDERWGIDNILSVITHEYSDQGLAVAMITMTDTQQALHNFDNAWKNSGAITPTLLFAQEATYRGIGLDELRVGSNLLQLSGSSLTMNFAPGGNALALETVHSQKWSPYCASSTDIDGNPEWAECPMDEYWGELWNRYADFMVEPGEGLDVSNGRMTYLQMYYFMIASGVSATIKHKSALMVDVPGISDATLREQLKYPKTTRTVVKTLVDLDVGKLTNKVTYNTKKLLRWIGLSKLGKPNLVRTGAGRNLLPIDLGPLGSGVDVNSILEAQPGAKSSLGSKVFIGLAIVAGAASLVNSVNSVTAKDKTVTVAATAVTVLGALVDKIVKPTYTAIRMARAGVEAKTILSVDTLFSKTSRKAAAVGAAVAIVVAWGFFIGSIIANKVEFGSVAFNYGLAGVLAVTIYIVVLSILSVSGVGTILVALLEIIDAIMLIVCAAKGEDLSECDTPSTKIIEGLVNYLYAYDLVVEIDPSKNPKLREMGAPVITLANPLLGYVAGNAIQLGVPITTTILHKDPEHYQAKLYVDVLFSANDLRRSTLRYSLTKPGASHPLEVDTGEMMNEWTLTPDHKVNYLVEHQMYRATNSQYPSLINPDWAVAGINRKLDYYFNSGLAVPAYSCWTIITVVICDDKTYDSSDAVYTSGPRLDIFPATLDAFMASTNAINGGQRLAWDPQFPTLYDADGDGLNTTARGGNDIDDTNPDSDGDGLTDLFELQQRQAGVNMAVDQADRDNDKLSDLQELQFKTDPASADTDNDGLSDGDEVYHQVYWPDPNESNPAKRKWIAKTDETGKAVWTGGWEVTVQPRDQPFVSSNSIGTLVAPQPVTMRISSNPTRADSDADGIPDDAEKRLYELDQLDPEGRPYNPNVANISPLQLFVDSDVVGSYVLPGQVIDYATSVVALTDFAPGSVLVNVPTGMNDGNPLTYALDPLQKATTTTVHSALTVGALANGVTLTVNSLAWARLQPEVGGPDWTIISSTASIRSDFSSSYAGIEVASTSTRPDYPGRYMLPALVSSSTPRGGVGEIKAYAIGGGTNSLAPESIPNIVQYRRSTTTPSSACNEVGECLTVWDQQTACTTVQINSLKVVAAGSDGVSSGIEPFIAYFPFDAQNYDPNDGEVSVDWAWYQVGVGGDWLTGTEIFNPGFPLQRVFCAPSNGGQRPLLAVFEADGAVDLVGNTTDWSETILVGAVTLYDALMNSVERNVTFGPNSDNTRIDLKLVNLPHQRNLLYGAIVDPNAHYQNNQIDILQSQYRLDEAVGGAQTGDFFPVVASDGTGYMVAWNRKQVDLISSNTQWQVRSSLMTRRYGRNGLALGPAYEQEAQTFIFAASADPATGPYGESFFNWDQAYNNPVADAIPSVLRAGDRYTVLWARPGSPASLRRVDLADGVNVGSPFVVATDVNSSAFASYRHPQIAYDPNNKRTMVVYYSNANTVKGLLYSVNNNTPVVLPSLAVVDTAFPILSLAYHPATRGWLVVMPYSTAPDNTMSYIALNASGNPLAFAQSNWASGMTLQPTSRPMSCPAPTSAPVLALAFEELSGAMTFSDESGNNRDAYCITPTANLCPVAGVPGVGFPGNTVVGGRKPPRTDRALFFDGINDVLGVPQAISKKFTIAFWLKTEQNQGNDIDWRNGAGIIDGYTESGPNDFGISLGGGKVLFGVDNITIRTPFVADNEWHLVVATRDPNSLAGGAMRLYLDGVLVAVGDGNQQTLDAGGYLTIGRTLMRDQHYRGALDYLTMYETVMAADAIAEMYKGQLPADLGYTPDASQCILAASTATGFPFVTISLKAKDTRGAGPLTASDELKFMVDAEAPVTKITAPLNNSYILAPPTDQPAGPPWSFVVAGDADDYASGVTSVGVQVNGGATEVALGDATWTHAVSYAGEGSITLQASAIDALGNVGDLSPVITVIADGTPPQLNTTDVSLVPRRGSNGSWLVALEGFALDPDIGLRTGSGINSEALELQLQNAAGDSLGWFPMTERGGLEGELWRIEYELPVSIGDPSGNYTITVRAADIVGNRAEITAKLRLDVPNIRASMHYEDQRIDTITKPMTLTGIMTGNMGMADVEAAIIPIDQVSVYSDTVLLLPLDEPAGALWFDDLTMQHNSASCYGDACPTAGVAGYVDSALAFNGSQFIVGTMESPSIDFGADESFTLQAWIKTSQTGGASLMYKGDGSNGYWLHILPSNQVALELNGVDVVRSAGTINDDLWHLVVAVVDRAAGEARMVVDGLEYYGDLNVGSVSNNGWISFGDGYVGLLDHVAIWNRALSTLEVQSLSDAAETTWRPLTVEAISATSARWSLVMPEELEGWYQIDVRATDNQGNLHRIGNVWRGVADRLAPRLTIDAEATGRTFVDPDSGELLHDISYTIAAEDLYLDQANFQTLCDGLNELQRGYQNPVWQQTLFPDLTIRDTLTIQCHEWSKVAAPVATASACDLYGNCSNLSQPVAASLNSAAINAASAPVIVWPPAGSVVAVSGPVEVQMAAVSAQPLKEMRVVINGNPGQKVEFAQATDVLNTVQTVSLDLAENTYDMQVQTTDWNGTVILGPVATFSLDSAPPTGSLLTNVLVEADSYAPASGVMRFRGNAGDTMGLSTVQLSVNDGPFADVTLNCNNNQCTSASWSTAAFVGAYPYGKSIKVTMRAVDLANRVIEESESLLVDIAAPEGFQAVTLPTLSINDVTVSENAGVANFHVTLSAAREIGTVAVHFATSDDSASQPSDYTARVGTAFILPGQTTVAISVPILDNAQVNSSKSFKIALSAAVNATIADDQGVATLTDNDISQPGTATIAINNVTVTEGEAAAIFTISLNQAIDKSVEVNFATSDGTAKQPGDYTTQSGKVTIAAGKTTATVSIPIVDDQTVESQENFLVNLSSPVNATIADGQGVATLTDNDINQPNVATISINDVNVSENDATAIFTVGLNQASDKSVEVSFATSDGTATQPDDYAATSGKVTIAAGKTTATISVPIVDDQTIEDQENFSVNLSSPVNASIADGKGVATLTNNDIPDEGKVIYLPMSRRATEASREANSTIIDDDRLPGQQTIYLPLINPNGAAQAPGTDRVESGQPAQPSIYLPMMSR